MDHMPDKRGGLRDILAGFVALFQSEQPGPTGEYRERETRVQCHYVVECAAEGDTFTGFVMDMSMQGLRLRVPRQLKPLSVLSVRYKVAAAYMASRQFDVETVRTTVQWCRKSETERGYEVGVHYSDRPHVLARSWVKFILRQLGFDVAALQDRRTSLRIKVLAQAHMSSYATQAVEGHVLHLGAAGCVFESGAALKKSQNLQLGIGPMAGLPPLHLDGQVDRVTKAGSRYHVRIGFHGMNEGQVELLGRYLVLLLNEYHNT